MLDHPQLLEASCSVTEFLLILGWFKINQQILHSKSLMGINISIRYTLETVFSFFPPLSRLFPFTSSRMAQLYLSNRLSCSIIVTFSFNFLLLKNRRGIDTYWYQSFPQIWQTGSHSFVCGGEILFIYFKFSTYWNFLLLFNAFQKQEVGKQERNRVNISGNWKSAKCILATAILLDGPDTGNWKQIVIIFSKWLSPTNLIGTTMAGETKGEQSRYIEDNMYQISVLILMWEFSGKANWVLLYLMQGSTKLQYGLLKVFMEEKPKKDIWIHQFCKYYIQYEH